MDSTAVYCRYCHQRLFDIIPGTRGIIEIKCSRCRRVMKICFQEQQKHIDYLEKE